MSIDPLVFDLRKPDEVALFRQVILSKLPTLLDALMSTPEELMRLKTTQPDLALAIEHFQLLYETFTQNAHPN